MVKLSDVETHEAWADFKVFLEQSGFLINTGLQHHNHPGQQQKESMLQLAFKHGFVEGSQHTAAEPEPPEEKKKRQYNGNRYVRPFAERHMDRKELEKYLLERGGPIELSDITAEMHKLGAMHWNTNNASAYVKTAIKDGANIVKVSTGVYQHRSTLVKEGAANE